MEHGPCCWPCTGGASVQKLWNLGLRRGGRRLRGDSLWVTACEVVPVPPLCVPIQPAATDIPSTRPKKCAPCRLARRLISRRASGIRFLSAAGDVFARLKGDHIRCFDCKSCSHLTDSQLNRPQLLRLAFNALSSCEFARYNNQRN